MLSRKTFVEDHCKAAQSRLAARLEMLKAKGLEDKAILKDAKVKQIKAEIRKAKHRMANIGAMEALTSQKAEAKAQKAAAAKAAVPQETKKAAKSAAPKKPGKEKKAGAAGSE